jgi:hypothetical protein
MNAQKLLLPLLGVAVVAFGWRSLGFSGVALAVGAIVMWMLLHFSRITTVLQRAAQRPVGWCDSAVMLNAKLRPGVNLLHVLALAKALGEQVSAKEAQPEVYRWTDGTQSRVTCEFLRGKLVKWELWRPPGTALPGTAGGNPPAA